MWVGWEEDGTITKDAVMGRKGVATGDRWRKEGDRGEWQNGTARGRE